jgi:hypothetical protein
MPYLCHGPQSFPRFFIVLHPHSRSRWAQLRNGVAGTLLRIDSTVPTHARLSGVTGLRKDPDDRAASWAKREPGTVRLATSSNLIGRTTESSFGFLPLSDLPTNPVASSAMDRTLRTVTAKVVTSTLERDAYCAHRHNYTVSRTHNYYT